MGKAIIDKITVNELEQIVKESSNISEALKKIGYTNDGGSNLKIFKNRCEKHKIDYSHFSNQGKNRGIKRTEENIFCENSTADQSTLRK